MTQALKDRLAKVKNRIAFACKESGRNPEEIKLLAVSKTKPIEMVNEISELGQLDFGENYAQDFNEKSTSRYDLRWHFIGRLQSNKIKLVVENCFLLHTLDSFNLAQKIEKYLLERNKKLDCLIQVNINKEPQKSGILPDKTEDLIKHVLTLNNLKIKGLMCIPDHKLSELDLKKTFAEMYELKNEINKFSKLKGDQKLSELSMGMSADLELAISQGSTIVRVGSDIFGPRS